ncbi:hypothetical protein BT69DRAFT_1315174 [Atractiella rhizophila]|nr:hypothetical protein BT69DRAFT_1315174 [Atractiella rhizophila]
MAPRRRTRAIATSPLDSPAGSEDEAPAPEAVRKGRMVAKKEKKPQISSRDFEEEENKADMELDFDFDTDDVFIGKDIGGRKLNNLITEWNVKEMALNEGLDFIKQAAIDVEECKVFQDGVGDDVVVMLDKEWRALSDKISELEAWRTALSSVRSRLSRDDEVTQPAETVREAVAAAASELASKTEVQKYGKNKAYAQFRQEIHEVNNSGTAMKPAKSFLPKGDGESDSDSDIEVGGSTQTFKCPITMGWLEDAVKSTICGHQYSREGVYSYIRENGGAVECPVTGCDKKITMNSLRDDPNLSRRVKEHRRRDEGRRQMGATQFQNIEDDSD